MTTQAAVMTDEVIDWNATLTSIAHSAGTPAIQPAIAQRRSRFFFILTEDDLAERKKAVAKKEVALVDEDLNRMELKVRTELPLELEKNANKIRDFFLRELSPRTLAIETGLNQAITILKRNGVDVDQSVPLMFLRMAQEGSAIRLSRFLETYLELPEGSARKLIAKPKEAKPKEHPVQPQNPNLISDQFDGLKRSLDKMVKTYDKKFSALEG